ncbi:hypothetical protein P3T36_003187 [Kitasatospora sp. MAP12-15]|uniref:hypothetical protein n=1 Tax=unclassified Kitasatospora TaxID=2633591 RepID=UPI002473E4E9|nr:hypothetical protein [Kitasatospora sp. MAP12-44]MDH6111163.1 hypothetical protein [Kitasatospora sp. MAP12-44]
MSTPPATTTPTPTPVTLSADQLTSLAQAIAQQLPQLLMTRDPSPLSAGDAVDTSGVVVSPVPVTVVTVAPVFPQPPGAAPTDGSSSTTTPAPGATS